MFLVITLCITLITALLPYIVWRLVPLVSHVTIRRHYDWLPIAAAVCYAVAWFIPDIHISDETRTFQQHFVGGGMYCAFLYVYLKQLLGWRLPFVASLIVLFAWVSAFGVANELVEFTLTKLQFAHIGLTDTDWDLVANTLGAFAGYILLVVTGVVRTRHR